MDGTGGVYPILVLAAVVAVAFNLRIVLAVGPVIDDIRADTGMSSATAGLLTTIPILCMGVFALAGPPLLRRRRAETIISFALVALVVATVVRALMPNGVLLVLLTLPIGISVAIAGAALPHFVKGRFPYTGGAVTGTYAAAMSGGAAAAAFALVPLDHALGGWRQALAAVALPAIIAIPLWLAGSTTPGTRPPIRVTEPTAARRLVVLLGLIFGLQAMPFSGMLSWIASAYRAQGWSPAHAGHTTGTILLISIPASLIVPALSDNRDRRPWIAAAALLLVTGTLGIALAPIGASWLWLVLFGLGNGAFFPLALALPLDFAVTPVAAAALTARMLVIGYFLSALSPFSVGFLRDQSGSFTLPFLVLAGIGTAAGVLAVVGLARHTRAVSHAWAAEPTPLALRSSLRRIPRLPSRRKNLGMAHATEASIRALDETHVWLVGVRPAQEYIPELASRRYLHSGPPIELGEIVGPMRGALIGALLFEGEAQEQEEAETIIDAGELELLPCADAACAGPMAGIITPRMPIVIAETDKGDRAYSPLNEGIGNALRMGSHDEATLGRLGWLADVAGPVLDSAIQACERIDLTDLVAAGLRRGDECHNRNVATSALAIATLAPAIVTTAPSREAAAEVLRFAAGNRHFALPMSVCVAKALDAAAHDISGSPIVTAMVSNGRRFGIRVSGLGNQWFTAPSPLGTPRLFEGYTIDDACPLIGDSAICETVGLGAAALTAAPAITSFVGGTLAESREYVAQMRKICAGSSKRFLDPSDAHKGTPIGIDVTRVATEQIAPVINNGIAHRHAGRGQVGAGITRMPIEPFLEAARLLAVHTSQLA